MAEVQMPELGENITEGTVTQWFKSVGEVTTAGEALFGVSTDKVDAEVPSPITGTITEIRAAVGETVAIGAVVAMVDAQGAAPAPKSAVSAPAASAPSPSAESPTPTPAPVAASSEPAPALAVPASAAPVEQSPPAPAPAASPVDARLVTSPVVRKLINELGSDASLVTGTGLDGRITRKDAEKVAYSEGHLASARTREARVQVLPASVPTPPAPSAGANFVPFNKIRKITGDRMVATKAISPHVMNVVEVDYERIESVRRKYQDRWKSKEGFTLTYLPFIARALVQSLRDFPHMNASVVEGGLVLHPHVDLNIAVDMNFEGLLAPIMRQVEDKRMPAIAREIAEIASRVRSGKARAEDIANGTFTISNSGPFGSFMVAPLINQPQVAILSTDGISRKPVVVTDVEGNESIAIHSVGMLVLSWDHRAFDGAYAASFLRRLKEILESHDWASEM